MGSFVFRWPHPDANDVHVTGTFDDWGKTEKLEKKGDVWEKEVDLPSADEKVLYKFVVDDQWVTDHAAPQEDDGHYNVNNVLHPDQIKKRVKSTPAAVGSTTDGATDGTATKASTESHEKAVPTISSAAPGSTSAGLAGAVPLERSRSPPGAFPETPANEAEDFSVQPIPAQSGASNPVSLAPGEQVPSHKEITSNDIDSKVTTSKEDYEKSGSGAEPEGFSVQPIPAQSGASNPISLAPGEPVPSHEDVTSNTVDSKVTTSKEDYEKSGSGAEPESYSVQPIPAQSTTTNPIELSPGEPVPSHKDITPHTVDSNVTTSKEDYEKAGSGFSGVLPAVGGAVAGAGVGAAAAGAASSAFSKNENKKNLIPESSLPMGQGPSEVADVGPIISSAGPTSTTAALAGNVPLEKKRQAVIIDSNDGPFTGAAASEKDVPAEVAKEKSAVEKELLSKTTKSQATGESADAAANQTSYYGLATSVPKTVEESMVKAQAAPEAAADSSVVAEKAALERELLQKVPSTDEAGEPAPTIAAATSETAPSTTIATAPKTSTTAETGSKTATAPTTSTTAETGSKTATAPSATTESSPGIGSGAAAAVGGAATLGAVAAGTAATTSGKAETAGSSSALKAGHIHDAVTTDSPTSSGVAGSSTNELSKAAGASTSTGVVGSSTNEFSKAAGASTSTITQEGSSGSVPQPKEPGVSPSTGATLADGSTDQALAEEPAVKMMHQNEVEKPDSTTVPATSSAPSAIASKPAAETTTSTKAAETSTSTAPVTSSATPGTTSTSETKPTSEPSKVGAPAIAAAPTSAVNTPTKKLTESATSSPASSSTKEKKKHGFRAKLRKIFKDE